MQTVGGDSCVVLLTSHARQAAGYEAPRPGCYWNESNSHRVDGEWTSTLYDVIMTSLL